MASTQHMGAQGEQAAAAFLSARGLLVVARNWRCVAADVRGEIDLVAWDGPVLVICEVKARRGVGSGGPLVAVTPRKQRRLRALAAAFLAATPARAEVVRFDVVGVSWTPGAGPLIQHVQDAF